MARILFVQNCNIELYAIMSIASFVNKRYQIKVSIGPIEKIVEDFRSFKPDVIGAYVLTKDHSYVLELSKQIKEINNACLVVLGGPHPTFYKDIIHEENIDAICVGEGEKSILSLLDRIENKKDYKDIPSIWMKKNGKIYKNSSGPILESDEIPLPDRSIYKDYPEIYYSSKVNVICSRGCPYDCAFCQNHGVKKMYGSSFYRIRDIDSVIQEILLVKKTNKNIKTISFQDDIFGMNKKWLKEFLREYKKKINIPFYCLLRCDVVSEEIIGLLKDAGCFEIGIGVETGDEKLRSKVLKKKLKNSAIIKAVTIFKRNKVKFHTFNMFGLPGEDLALAYKTVAFSTEELKADVVWSAMFQPYPGTEYFSEDTKSKIINPNFDRFKVNYAYNNDYKYIQRLQKLFLLTSKYTIIGHFLPILVRLPLDKLYDKVSDFCWHQFYYKRISNQ